MSKTSRFFLGALVGAAAALLLTPVTGRRLRSKAKKMAKDAGLPTDKVEDAIAKLKEKAEEMAGGETNQAKRTTRAKRNNNQK